MKYLVAISMCAAALVGAPACTAETDVSASQSETASASFNFAIPDETAGSAQPVGGFNFSTPGENPVGGTAMPGLGSVELPDEAEAVLQDFEPSIADDALAIEG